MIGARQRARGAMRGGVAPSRAGRCVAALALAGAAPLALAAAAPVLAPAVAAVLAAARAAADPPPATLEALMEGMARAQGVVAEFRETKEIALLAAPLTSRGVLHYVPPDRMVRRTLEPAPATLVVDGARVRFDDGSGAPPLDLSGDPSARAFVENVTLVFRGDLDALRRRYEVRFEADPPRWRLLLEPRDAMVRRFVERLELAGEGEALREMVLVERDGDRTTTRFERVETDHAHTPEELAALFGDAGGPAGGAPPRGGGGTRPGEGSGGAAGAPPR
jgi:hypothetical protein